ncbi:MAG: MFS transporter [Blastocatellia bacterium]|nr:MFS transporter [Blastocatellia bacterium]
METPQSSPANPSPPVSNSYAWFALGMLTLLNLLNYVDRFIFAALIPYIKTDTGFSDGQIGIIGSAFTWIYTICAPLFGYLGDRYHRGRLIAFGITVWSLATAGAGISRNFVQLLFARSAVGIGEANYATIAPGLLSDFFTKARRGMAMSVFFATIPIGTAIGYLVGGSLGKPESWGWRHTLYLVGLPGLVTAVLMLFLKEPVRGAMDEKEPSGVTGQLEPVKPKTLSWKEGYVTLFTNLGYLCTCLGYASVTFAVGALVFWAPEWLKSDKGISAEEANTVLGVCAVLGGSIGTLVGGVLGDQMQKRMKGAYFRICSVSAAISAIPTLIAIMSSNPMVYKTSIFLAITILFLGNGPVNTVLVNLVPVNLRTTALGLVVVIIHVLGDGISLSLVGAISTWLRKTAEAGGTIPGFVTSLAGIFHINPATQTLSTALLLMPVGMLVGGGFYFLGLKTKEGQNT